MRTATEILSQFQKAGVLPYVVTFDPHGGEDSSINGFLNVEAVAVLDQDPRFARGPLHALHADVGEPRTEFRAHPGEVGDGSLQIVINTETGRFYADIDRFSPYTDVVNSAGHAFAEVLPNWLKKIGRRLRRQKGPA